MTAKYTSGPWKVKIKNAGIADIEGEKLRCKEHGDRQIAILFRADDRHDAIDEWSANIALIVCAQRLCFNARDSAPKGRTNTIA